MASAAQVRPGQPSADQSANPTPIRQENRAMLISTMNDLPGYEVTEVLGEVFGITVRSRNVGSQFGAGLKSIVGGELKGMTKMLNDSRSEAQDRLGGGGEQPGAAALLALRFDANALGFAR